MLSRMHTMLFVMVFVAFGWAGLALGQQKPEELAQQSSEAWLTLIDRGQFADSYQEAAQYFKNAVTKDQWQTPDCRTQTTRQGPQELDLHQDAARRA